MTPVFIIAQHTGGNTAIRIIDDLAKEGYAIVGGAPPVLKVGDRVVATKRDHNVEVGDSGTVRDVRLHGVEVAFDESFKNRGDGVWFMYFDEVELAPKSRGAIISEQRASAGLPPFAVGDVVNYNVTKNDWQNLTVEKIEGGLICATDPIHGEGSFYPSWLTLVDSAPTLTIVPRTFVVGDFVRILYGEFGGKVGHVDFDDGDPECLSPYTVTVIGTDDGDTYDADELDLWEPVVGNRVVASDTNETISAGTVKEVVDGDGYDDQPCAYVYWDDTSARCAVDGPWSFHELEPYADPPAVSELMGRLLHAARLQAA